MKSPQYGTDSTVRYAALQCDKKGNPQLKAPLKGNFGAYDCPDIFYGVIPRARPYIALHTVPGMSSLARSPGEPELLDMVIEQR